MCSIMNRQKGYFLLELNVALLIILLLIVGFYQYFLQALLSLKRMQSDVDLCLNERLLVGRIERELTFETEQLEIRQATPSQFSILVLWKKKHGCYRKFFCHQVKHQNFALYQETKHGAKHSGVNPLTPPRIKVLALKAEKVENNGVQLTLEIALTESGRKKRTVKFMRLLNGVIYEQGK